VRRDEAQVDASLGRKDGMGFLEASAMFAQGRVDTAGFGERGVKCERQAEASLPAGRTEKPADGNPSRQASCSYMAGTTG